MGNWIGPAVAGGPKTDGPGAAAGPGIGGTTGIPGVGPINGGHGHDPAESSAGRRSPGLASDDVG